MISQKMPFKADLKIHQGATFSRKITWLDTQRMPAVDLSDFNAKMKLSPTDKSLKSVVLHSADGGIVLNSMEGSITITLSSHQTRMLKTACEDKKWGSYDLILIPKVGEDPVYGIIYGDVFVSKGYAIDAQVDFNTNVNAPPVFTSNPIIVDGAGSVPVGATIQVSSNGVVTGTEPIYFTYKWFADGSEIVGETSSSYNLLTVYNSVYCEVTASNSLGEAVAQSNVVTVYDA